MATEDDYQRAIEDLQACSKALEQMWTFVTGDWDAMTDFAGPTRDELAKRFTDFGDWYANAKAGLDQALEEAARRKVGCHIYETRVYQYNTGQRLHPPSRPWYCDELPLNPPPQSRHASSARYS